MRRPLIERRRHRNPRDARERGVTMALVALSLVALISMAALSIDLGSLYEAKAEAQRAADLGALAAARVISLEGLTGDTTASDTAWEDICGSASSPASLAAINVAEQNLINGSAASTVTVNYGTAGSFDTDCSAATGTGFTVNPLVQVYVQQANLPNFFSRIFSLVVPGGSSNSGVSATATAEVFNSSGSGSLSSGMVPVQPRCVKPWVLLNIDPNTSLPFVSAAGVITKPGVNQLDGTGVIGENFILKSDCLPGKANCLMGPPRFIYDNPPAYLGTAPGPGLEYLPALVSVAPIAVAANNSCSSVSGYYQSAIAGCDQNTVYACGTPSGASLDLSENPAGAGGDTELGTSCLINTAGPDQLAGYTSPTSLTSYPFEIMAGAGNPYVQAGVVNNSGVITTSNSIMTVSNSIVTVPIANFPGLLFGTQPTVTVVGYLQLFIDQLNTDGSMVVTVLNVSGCGDSSSGTAAAHGTSPVPVRLITPQ